MGRVTAFAFVGFGYRAGTLHQVSTALPEVRCAGAVVRSPRTLPVPAFGSLAECLDRARPDFLVTALPHAVNPDVVTAAVAAGVPILSETPPAADLAGLRRLWAATGESGLVQVAEQYPLMPTHAARLAAVRSGIIGAPTQVQVSSTQRHHAVALIRRMLDVGSGPAVVRASRTTAPLVDPLDRTGWTDDFTPKPATTTLATIDFGDGRSGLYDFTSNQTRNLLRFRRMLIRGTHGEIRDDEVVHLPAPRTILRSPLVRRQTGHELDLNGYETETITFDGEVLYRNPFPGTRFNDDEIASATLLRAMTQWVRGNIAPPYPLADGAQDHLIALAIDEAAETGCAVTTTTEPWA